VLVFRQQITPEDAIGFHACSLEASMHVTNGIPLGCPLPLTVTTVNSVQTLKAPASEPETLTMLAFQADRQFTKLLDLHAFAQDVRQNYAACAELPSVIDDEYNRITGAVAAMM
jgi:hypothetical protein